MNGCPTGASGTHHINGEQCMGRHCTYTTAQDTATMFEFMSDLGKKMNVPSTKGFVDKSDPNFRPKGTTVLSCGCGIKWEPKHGRGKASSKGKQSMETDVLICKTHGITAIDDFR